MSYRDWNDLMCPAYLVSTLDDDDDDLDKPRHNINNRHHKASNPPKIDFIINVSLLSSCCNDIGTSGANRDSVVPTIVGGKGAPI